MTTSSSYSTEPPAPPPLTSTSVPDTGETRAEVLRVVTRLIGERGADGMTMRQVAQAAGMSTGTINYHFSNKRSLILAALDGMPSAPRGVDAGSSVARLQALFRGFILEDEERRDWWRFWVEVTAQAARDADLRDRQRARMETQRQEVATLIEAGVRDGELRPELDATLLAEPLLALAHGLAVQQLVSPDAATVLRASDALEGSIREIAVR